MLPRAAPALCRSVVGLLAGRDLALMMIRGRLEQLSLAGASAAGMFQAETEAAQSRPPGP